MDAGLVDEVDALMKNGVPLTATSMQGLGYKEIAAYLNGEYDLDEAVRVLKRDTRHFAKRQITWYKREKDVMYFDKTMFETTMELANALVSFFMCRE